MTQAITIPDEFCDDYYIGDMEENETGYIGADDVLVKPDRTCWVLEDCDYYTTQDISTPVRISRGPNGLEIDMSSVFIVEPNFKLRRVTGDPSDLIPVVKIEGLPSIIKGLPQSPWRITTKYKTPKENKGLDLL